MTFYKMIKPVVTMALILTLGFTAVTLHAQTVLGRGRLKGVVMNEEGEYVVNALVKIVWQEDQRVKHETRTNKKGKFFFKLLGSGNWDIFINADGYRYTKAQTKVRQLTEKPAFKIVIKKAKSTDLINDIMKGELKEIFSQADNAYQLFVGAEYDKALELFEQLLAKQPQFYQIHYFIGNCYKEKGELDRAMAEYEKILEKTSGSTGKNDQRLIAQAQAAIGDIYIDKNDLKTAREYFKKSLELYPKNQILAYNLGEIFFADNKTEQAILYFKLAASIKPDWGKPHLKLGYIYLNTEDNKNAIASFKKFLELTPQSKQAAEIKELIKSLETMSLDR